VSRAACVKCNVVMLVAGTYASSPAEVRDVYRCPSCAVTVSLPHEDLDVRPVKADARETFDLFEGARYRKFSDAQIEYLVGCVGITWAKAFRAGQKAGPES
jgi:hypothetical protein